MGIELLGEGLHSAGVFLIFGAKHYVILCIKVKMMIYPYISCPTPGLAQESNQISSPKIKEELTCDHSRTEGQRSMSFGCDKARYDITM